MWSLNLVFSGKGLRVELYFGSRDPEISTKRFDAVARIHSKLQEITSSELVLEPLEGKKASRVSIYGPVADVEDRDSWQSYRSWFVKEYQEMRKVVNSQQFKTAVKSARTSN